VKKIAWSERARVDIRGLNRETAMRIFAALDRFAESGEGDIKRLQGTASPRSLVTSCKSTPCVTARMLIDDWVGRWEKAGKKKARFNTEGAE
jgi:hypothetical protein